MSGKEKEPWDRPEWAKNEIISQKNYIVFLWIFAILWLGISSPAVFMGIPEKMREEDYGAIALIALFPLIGIGLLCSAFYATLQKIKYGVSSVRLNDKPLVIGASNSMKLLLPTRLKDMDGLSAKLFCIRRKVRGSGKHKRIHEDILWQSSRTLLAKEGRIVENRFSFDLEFTIPFDCLDYDDSNFGNQVLWSLHVNANMPGIDFSVDFKLPVFKTEKSNPEVIGISEADVERILTHPPRLKGIIIQEISDGLRIYLKPFRFIGSAIFAGLFGAIFGGIGIFLWTQGIWFITIIFFPIGLFVMLMGVHLLFVSTEIVIWENYGQIKTSWFGLGTVKEFELSSIKDFAIAKGSHSTSGGRQPKSSYTVEIIPHTGKSLKLADMTKDHDQILWIVAKLKEYLPERNA
jgi:hypothetical protein